MWQTLVILKIFGGSIVAPFAFRLLGNAAPRERIERILVQFLWAALFASLLMFALGDLSLGAGSISIAVVGALMPIGVFFQWRAYAYSLSRGAIFMGLMNIIPLVLSAVVLGEWRVFVGNGVLLLGFGVAIVGTALHLVHDIRRKREKEETTVLPLAFYGNAFGFKLILGVATFLLNYWAKTDVPATEFLVSWYWGAALGAGVLFLTTRGLPKGTFTIPRQKEQVLLFVAAASIILNLGLMFLTFQNVEQTVAMPIFAVGDIIGPVLIGMVFFREWKQISGAEWFYLALGINGSILIALSR